MTRRKRKDTFFQDMARDGLLKVLRQMSQAGEVEDPQNAVLFQVYPSKDPVRGDLCCDLPCVMGGDRLDNAKRCCELLGEVWAINPFQHITHTPQGFLYFKIPDTATKR